VGFPPEVVDKLRNALRAEFHAEVSDPKAIFDHGLWKALLSAAGDPETEVPDWLANGCPTGIGESRIKACGVFPLIDSTSAAIESSKEHARVLEMAGWHQEKHRNYQSFYEKGGKYAGEEVDRIIRKGFVQAFQTWEEVTARWPGAKASKVAVIVKERPDRTHKTRLIIDMRRSGVNGGVVLNERVVMPRLSDFVSSILDLMEYDLDYHTSAMDWYEVCTVDFEDAFHTLRLREADRGVMAFRTLEGWAVFDRLCCGMAAAPLVWCRTSAAGCRLGQACFRPEELRIQCFVDDPAIVVRGSPPERSWMLGSLLLFWHVLGFRFNWGKGARGQEVPWIGATIKLDKKGYGANSTRFPGVLVSLTPGKFTELQQAVDEIHNAKGMINLRLVQRVAGQLSWASGMFNWIRGFNSCLWAAITAHTAEAGRYENKFSTKKRPVQLFFVLRIAQAIAWIRMLLAGLIRDRNGHAFKVQKWTSVATRRADLTWCVRTDASPFGMGAILFKNQAPVAWMAEEWTKLDLELLKAKSGDPAWQAEWELLAMLIAVDKWLPHLHGQAFCMVQTDATAALHDAARMAGRTPAMNAMAAELALRFESAQLHVVPKHLSGTMNFECDALSRLARGAAVPKVLMHTLRATPRPRDSAFFWAWPRELLRQHSAADQVVACGQGASGTLGRHSLP
jgi:hypothetical protein